MNPPLPSIRFYQHISSPFQKGLSGLQVNNFSLYIPELTTAGFPRKLIYNFLGTNLTATGTPKHIK